MNVLIEAYKIDLNEEQTIQVFKQIRYILSLIYDKNDLSISLDMKNLHLTNKIVKELKKIINILIIMIQEQKLKSVNLLNSEESEILKNTIEYSGISNRFHLNIEDSNGYDEIYKLDWRYQYIVERIN